MRRVSLVWSLLCCALVASAAAAEPDLFADPELDRFVEPLRRRLALEGITRTIVDEKGALRRLLFPGYAAERERLEALRDTASAVFQESITIRSGSKIVDVTLCPSEITAQNRAAGCREDRVPCAQRGRFVAIGDPQCLIKFTRAVGWPDPEGVVAVADRLAEAPAMHPRALATALKKFGHPVRWQSASPREKRETSIAGRIHWPVKSDGELDTVVVYDFGTPKAAGIQAEQVLAGAQETGEGFQGVVAGRWLYAGDAMRIGIVRDGLRDSDAPGEEVSTPRRQPPGR
ncbi:MAG: hypothetical protein AB7O68_20015 [Pirellulales bacterium]